MSGIHRLQQEVADAIAAGEVIERPASVVKELVENALDADARRITVEVRGAGRTSIRVSDDGAGIVADELPLAFMRHATSKVSTLADLHGITSLGFRGEALASIAAVADVTCASGGAQIHLRAGEALEHGSGPLLPGVNIEVTDLFANVPARLKFLKSDATEVAAIRDVVSALALLHPHVKFHLTVDGRLSVGSGGDGDRRRASAAVHGPTVAAEMLEIVGLPLVSGLVSQPRVSRGTRDWIVLAVNGRPIMSRTLVFALEECYQGRLERGRHPIAVLDIGIDPELVDVNVHPSKREVRFRDENTVFAAVQRAVRAALGGSEPFFYRAAPPSPLERNQTGQLATAHEAWSSVAVQDLVVEPAPAGVPLRPLGQVGPGYLVAEGPQGVVLVDQHAAHERILYNRLLARLREGRGMSQPLLMPAAIDVEPALMAAAADHEAALSALGLELVEFGPRSLRILAVPAEMPASRATKAVQETLSALSESRSDEAVEKAAAALACHSAVRFGDVLDLSEQRRLLSDLELADEAVTCPHGRPTRLLIEWQELTRHFRRNY
ncbi:MAG: DNA mismatch repair endonuclease MutL [Chloroflexi bacterium]|nr:MAG: DNA mismatch repair endonuclease MutL [Chloroflexota bacterium]TME95382.1 MAG: DNA mismatch repair endonuclease MutL [Chloroflexota bacterium]